MSEFHPPQAGDKLTTRCCVVGGGPAGLFLGYLLGRAGVEVIVLEKHQDFLRDFRGDTIHPSTLELMHELGILEEFLQIADKHFDSLALNLEGKQIEGPYFTHLPTKCKFITFAPQWDFLNLIAEHASKYPNFQVHMQAQATDLIRQGDQITGVKVNGVNGEYEIHANLIVGADGRGSQMRIDAGVKIVEKGIPIDVLWFRIKKSGDSIDHTLGRIKNGRMLVTIDRGDYFQTGMIIHKGYFDELKQEGLEEFRNKVTDMLPHLAEGIAEIVDWNQVRLLSVQLNHITNWAQPGLLFIGDAAHAMSPVGGVGVNLAVQDAVATANLLADKLYKGNVTLDDLKQVQLRREAPALKTQRMQVFAHQRLFGKQTPAGRPVSISWGFRKVAGLFAPLLRQKAGKIIGLGFLPEHIQTPERAPKETATTT
ncbi:FAD-dependent oxidoreductase [Gimesia aquarii]|uniref:p-hydroxybenzoate hydroxylase n=1 Tax=Gimesia aquarii TaxID=2527964 RepID=A0A517WX25_9PLAN|nr:FAD-dependent oxidoreductase [Gimesia aquarii]QDU09788.1 p-hydroxybenzoate hydroxylase [Gimesia aquarii]